MRLLLTVLSAQRSNLGERSTHAFDLAGGTIGRSASCDWSLPDASNTLSARHASVAHNGHGFVITDTSTNGVYLNSVDMPIGRGQSAPLAHGDTLYISDYVVSVALVREPAPPPRMPSLLTQPAPLSAMQASPMPAMPLPGMPLHDTTLSALPAPAPATGFGGPAGSSRIGLSMDDLLGPPPLRTGSTSLPAAPPPASAPAPNMPAPAPAIPPSPPGMPVPAASEQGRPPLALIPDDFDFGDLLAPPPAVRQAAPPPPPYAAPPPSVPPAEPMQPRPAAAPAPIPTDFDRGLAALAGVPADVPALPPLAPPPSAPLAASRPPGLDGMALPDLPVPAASALAGAPDAGAALDPLAMLRHRAIARAASIDLSRPSAEEPRAAGPAPAPRPAIGAVALPGGPAAEDGDAAVFWQALGLDPGAIPAPTRQDMLAQLGRAMRESASGLVAILSARKSLKDEFRIDQTRLAALENNPFKFFRSGADALRSVVVEGKPGYLPLDRAVKQGFADIQAHEVATVVAMQSALRKLLARMSPAAIEAGASPGLLGRKPDKSKLWERYVEAHSELAGDLDRTTREMLAEEFARAYAEQTQAAAEAS